MLQCRKLKNKDLVEIFLTKLKRTLQYLKKLVLVSNTNHDNSSFNMPLKALNILYYMYLKTTAINRHTETVTHFTLLQITEKKIAVFSILELLLLKGEITHCNSHQKSPTTPHTPESQEGSSHVSIWPNEICKCLLFDISISLERFKMFHLSFSNVISKHSFQKKNYFQQYFFSFLFFTR